jgi:uncharacterized protein (UPF0332 family)
MSIEYEQCLKKGKISPFSKGRELAPRELELAKEDFAAAGASYKEGKYKWATIQTYYSMFHSAWALLYARNLRERSHFCLIEAVRALYAEPGKISVLTLDALKKAKMLREDADYYGRWTQEDSEKLLNAAQEFLKTAQKIILGNHEDMRRKGLSEKKEDM